MGGPSSPIPLAIPKGYVDWAPIKRAYIDRSPVPDTMDLAKEFGVSPQKLARAIFDEDWAVERCNYWVDKAQGSNVVALMANAAQRESKVIDLATEKGIAMLMIIGTMLEELDQMASQDKRKALTTRSSILTGLSMTYSNVTRNLAELGVTGLPKELRKAAKEQGGVDSKGDWRMPMIQKIEMAITMAKRGAEKAADVASVDLPARDVSQAAEVPAG